MDLSNFWWQSGDSGFNPHLIGNSLRFRGVNSGGNPWPHLTRTTTVAGDQHKYTWSAWVKRGFLTVANTVVSSSQGNGNHRFGIFFEPSGKVQTDYGGIGVYNDSRGVYRDPAAWYHLFWAVDTTQADPNQRSVFYVNGSTSGDNHVRQLSQNQIMYGNELGAIQIIGNLSASGNFWPFNGYMADVRFFDGFAHSPTHLGEFDETGAWRAKKDDFKSSDYGKTGFHLDFSDPANIGKDSSGNNNHFTPTGFELTDSTKTDYDWVKDSPTDNYSTLNPLNIGDIPTYKEGNLGGETGGWAATVSVPLLTTGKWYYEFTPTSGVSHGTADYLIGIDTIPFASTNLGTTANSYGYHSSLGSKWNNGTRSPYGATWQHGDVIGVAYDLDARELTFFKNGVSQGVAFNNLPAGVPLGPAVSAGNSSQSFAVNFGNRPFKHTPPAGFKPLSTAGLPSVPIKNPSEHFTTILDSGANILTAAQAKFPNGLWWIKDRANNNQHQLVDSVNGTAKVRTCPGNADAAYVAPAGNSVAWCWATPASGINTAAGFSITNGTHGLGVAPDFVIDRSLNIYHKSLPAGNGSNLNTSNGYTGQAWTVNATTVSGPGGATYYSWTSVPGYSSFGSYQGNGNADGPFIYTGFRPAFVLVKYFSTVANHGPMVFSSAIDTYNPTSKQYLLSHASSEGSRTGGSNVLTSGTVPLDLLSNGFKCRGNHTEINNSGTSYWYAAWAEHPFGGGNVSPATAR